jgi:hypothetical protein
MQHGPDTQFPLSLDSAQRVYAVHEDPGEPYGAPQPNLYIPVTDTTSRTITKSASGWGRAPLTWISSSPA